MADTKIPPDDAIRRDFYRRAVELFNASGIPYVVGGAYALDFHTGVTRHTNDLDVFVLRQDCERVLDRFARAGYRTDLTFSHWLGKVFYRDHLIDVIFSSGNGLCSVDEQWFEHAVPGELLGMPVPFSPPEEMIWSKAFIMERERYDGADIAHLIRGCSLDWPRLLDRFGPHWHVLLSHLVLFWFIYPDQRDRLPRAMMRLLLDHLEAEVAGDSPMSTICHGTLLSLQQYLTDLRQGYQDARLTPHGRMSPSEVDQWTAAFIDPE
jgi:hypothetical protein